MARRAHVRTSVGRTTSVPAAPQTSAPVGQRARAVQQPPLHVWIIPVKGSVVTVLAARTQIRSLVTIKVIAAHPLATNLAVATDIVVSRVKKASAHVTVTLNRGTLEMIVRSHQNHLPRLRLRPHLQPLHVHASPNRTCLRTNRCVKAPPTTLLVLEPSDPHAAGRASNAWQRQATAHIQSFVRLKPMPLLVLPSVPLVFGRRTLLVYNCNTLPLAHSWHYSRGKGRLRPVFKVL